MHDTDALAKAGHHTLSQPTTIRIAGSANARELYTASIFWGFFLLWDSSH